MAIRFICPKGHRLTAPDERAGVRGRCPLCNARVVVPLGDEIPANVAMLGDQTGWVEVRFRSKTLRRSSTGVATPLEETTASTDLPEPLSPADFAAKKSMSTGHPTPKATSPPPAKVPIPPVPEPEAQGPFAAEGDTADPDVYRLDRQGVRKVYILASVEVVLTLFIASPALTYLGLHGAAAWAWIVLLLVALQTLYMLWVVALPDWSTVWIGSLVFGLTSATHLLGLTLCLAIAKEDLPLGLASTNAPTGGWCAAVTILSAGMAYACIHISRPWREAYETYKAVHRD